MLPADPNGLTAQALALASAWAWESGKAWPSARRPSSARRDGPCSLLASTRLNPRWQLASGLAARRRRRAWRESCIRRPSSISPSLSDFQPLGSLVPRRIGGRRHLRASTACPVSRWSGGGRTESWGPLPRNRVCGSKSTTRRSKIPPTFSLLLLRFCLLFFNPCGSC